MSAIPFGEWKKLDLRVGKIVDVQDHPDADKLLVMRVDAGDGTRTVVAGIKAHYTKKELVGKNVIIFVNLEQKEVRGIKSEGMILAAVSKDAVVLLSPGKDIAAGSRVE